MTEEKRLVIKITGTVQRGSSRPVAVLFQVTAQPGEAPDRVREAVTEACRQLNAALKECVQ